MTKVVDQALSQGYTIALDCDVSEPTFLQNMVLARFTCKWRRRIKYFDGDQNRNECHSSLSPTRI